MYEGHIGMTIEELYEKYHTEMIRWGTKMTGSEQSAEELVQEAFLRMIMNEELFSCFGEKQARSWLYRTAKNIFIDKVRRSARETIVGEIPEQGRQPDEFGELEWEELIGSLPDVEGVIFKMKCEGYTSLQIGNILQLPAGTVRSKLCSARKRLIKFMQ